MSDERAGRGWSGRLAGQFRGLGMGAGQGVVRFPLTTLLIVLFAILANWRVAAGFASQWSDLSRALSAVGAAAAVSLALRLALEPFRISGWVAAWLLPAAGALLAGGAVWLGTPLWLYAPPLTAAAVLAVPLAPFVWRGTADDFWLFLLWTLVGVTLAFFSVLLFVTGLFAILEMVRFLFGIGFDTTLYRFVGVTAFALVGPLFALGRIPAIDRPGGQASDSDRLVAVVRPLFDWVAVPLALVTGPILHLYALRIAFTGQVPVNQIGWIVSFYGLLLVALRIAVHPFTAKPTLATRVFVRFWAVLLVVPVGLALYAIALRVDAFGVTAPRYFLILIQIGLVAAIGLQLAQRTRGEIRWLAALAPVLLVAAVSGPWGVGPVVARSQLAQIERLFANGSAIEASALDSREQRALRSRIVAMGDVGQLDRLSARLPAVVRAEVQSGGDPQRRTNALLAALGLRTLGVDGAAMRSFASKLDVPYSVEGFDHVLPVPFLGEGAVQEGRGFSVALSGNRIAIAIGAASDEIELASLVAGLSPELFEDDQNPEPPVLDLRTEEGRTVRLRLESITLDRSERVTAIGLTLMLRQAEWGSFGGG